MGQKNRRDSRGRFAQPILSPMSPEATPPKLVSVSIKNLKDNPSGVVVEETEISTSFGQNLGEALDQALLTNNETDSKETLTKKTKEVTMSKEEVKNEVVETTNTEAAPKKETTKATPQKKEEKKAEATPAPAKKEEAPKAEAPKEQPIAKGNTATEAKQDLREAVAVATDDDSNKREVVIREEYDTGRAMLHNFGVGLAIGGGVVLGAALASGVIYLVKKQFGGEESSAE